MQIDGVMEANVAGSARGASDPPLALAESGGGDVPMMAFGMGLIVTDCGVGAFTDPEATLRVLVPETSFVDGERLTEPPLAVRLLEKTRFSDRLPMENVMLLAPTTLTALFVALLL